MLSILESAHNVGDPGWIPGSGRAAGEGIGYPLQCSWASLVAQLVKNLLQCGRPGFDPWVREMPWRRERLLTPVIVVWRIPWTVAHLHPCGFSRQENWNGLTFSSPENLSNQGFKSRSPTLQQILYHLSHQGIPVNYWLNLRSK